MPCGISPRGTPLPLFRTRRPFRNGRRFSFPSRAETPSTFFWGTTMATFQTITTDKKQYLPLLLLADPCEAMIDRYLERGTMYILDDNGVKGVCVVTDEGDGILEIKNIATDSHFHRKGYGRMLIKFIEETYHNQYSILQVGTGDSPLTIPFYEACGFVRSHAVKDFFVKNYDHAIYECGIQLKDMIYLRKNLL